MKSMRRASYLIWITLAIGVTADVAGCSASHAPTPSDQSAAAAPSPSHPPVDPAVAFAQYEKAANPFDCSSAYAAMSDAFEAYNYGALQDNVARQRATVASWDAELGRIAFPPATQSIVDRMREHNATEMAALTELAAADVNDHERMDTLFYQIDIANSSVTLKGDELRAALGHPVPRAGVAADQLDLANLTYFQASGAARPKWTAALQTDDLNAAKAANGLEEDAAQAYIDRLGTIDWPPKFDDQITALRDSLHRVIDFDRHQVDVATAAQIDPSPGTDLNTPIKQAEQALWNPLVQAFQSSSPGPVCAEPLHPR